MTKQSTLRELVQGTVEGFLATETPFSVYDVTTSIRTLVNSGVVEVPSLSVINPSFGSPYGQTHQFEITHDDVKFYFNDLYENGGFSQTLTRQRNGAYFVYEGINPNPIKQTSNSLTRLAQALGTMRNVPATVVSKTPSAAPTVRKVAAAPTKLDRKEVIERVRTYQTNCRFRQITPTTKQIQSAIKRHGKSTGWTRDELKTIWQGISNGTI